MLDLWPDGKIDCKDYAIRNSVEVQKQGNDPRWVIKDGNHVFIMFDYGEWIVVVDGDKMYGTRRPAREGLEERPVNLVR